jgi:hypothetical protein
VPFTFSTREVPMRSELLFLPCALGIAACTTKAVSPQTTPNVVTTPQSTTPETPALLRRLAEAADGYRDGRDHFVVANRVFPHYVHGVFESRDSAQVVADSLASRIDSVPAVFGPFRTKEESPPPNPRDVDSVVVYRTDKTTKTYNGQEYDALVWSLPAFDKFLVPYLTSVYGIEEAARQRELYLSGKSPLAHSTAVDHKRSSL